MPVGRWVAPALTAVALAACASDLPTHPTQPVPMAPPVALHSGGGCPWEAIQNCSLVDGNVASQWISDLESQLDPNAHYLCLDALAAIEFATLHFTTDFPP
jgi:hypothetical protein